MDSRKANDRIAEKAAQLRFVSRVPMLCECSATGCRAVVMIGLSDYRQIRSRADARLTAPGHSTQGAELDERTPGYDVHRVTGADQGDGDRRSA